MTIRISNVEKFVDRQLTLLYVRGVSTLGAARYEVGSFFESVTAKWLRCKRLRTSGEFDACPDLLDEKENAYVECKAVGRNRSAILYKIRINKDRQVVDQAAPRRLRYVFWRHNLKIKEQIVESRALVDLHDALLRSVAQVCIVEFDALEALCKLRPTRVLNTGQIQSGPNRGDRLGFGSKGYGIGWAIPYVDLVKIATHVEGWSTWR